MKRSLILFALLAMAASAFCLTKEEFPNVVIYHDNEDRNTLREIDELIARENETIQRFLGVTVSKRELYVYRNQKEMQRQKHPILSFVLKPDWYIGDNIGQRAIPPVKIFSSNDSVYFANNGGYQYADKFIEFVDSEYGHDALMALVKDNRYERVLGKPLDAIYGEWKAYLMRMYP